MTKSSKFAVMAFGMALSLSATSLAQLPQRSVPRPPARDQMGSGGSTRPPVENNMFQSAQPSAPQNGSQKRDVPRPPDEMRQGARSGDWLRRNMNLPPEQQKKQLQNDQNFKRLPAEQQQRLMQRLDRFNQLKPEQKQRLLDRMEWMEHLPPEQHQQVQQMRQEMQQLDPSRRQAIRDALGSMRGMNPDQRKQAIDSDQMKGRFNDGERNIMKGITDMRNRHQEEKRNGGNGNNGGGNRPPRK